MRHWTPSKLKDYEKCPSFYEGRHILRLPEKESDALKRGNDIHSLLEVHVTTKGSKLPKALGLWKEELDAVIAAQPIVEQMWSYGPEWAVEGSPLWARMKLDVFYAMVVGKKHHGKVIDYKTGRIYPEHKDQLEQYAVASFHRYPTISEIQVELWYIDQNDITEKAYTRDQLPELTKKWTERANRLVTADQFPPTPSDDACKWCPRHRKKGGDCKEGV